MRIAEIVIKEYIQNGYSIDELRSLVENRPEPLRSELISILDSMEEATEVQCECTIEESIADVCVTETSSGMLENVSRELGQIMAENDDILGSLSPEAAAAESASAIAEISVSTIVEPEPVEHAPELLFEDAAMFAYTAPEQQTEATVAEPMAVEYAPHLLDEQAGMFAAAAPEVDEALEQRRAERRRRRAQRRALKKLEKEQAKMLPAPEEPAQDYCMIVANGGDEAPAAELHLLPAAAEHSVCEPEQENNVILFRDACPVYDEEPAGLRMLESAPQTEILSLPAPTDESAASAAAEAQASANLAAEANANAAAADEARAIAEAKAEAALAEAEAAHAAEAEARQAAEQAQIQYQKQLDEISAQLRALQQKVEEDSKALEERDAELQTARSELSDAQKNTDALRAELESVRTEADGSKKKLDTFRDALDEHKRLYNEFEGLRQAYNEIVTSVMPGLQKERDDLAYTVEKQSESEQALRLSLAGARRRTTASYALGAAACAALVALPLINWFKSDDANRTLAQDKMQAGELAVRLEKAERRNVENDTEIYNLKRQINEQLAQIEAKNAELNRLSDKRAMMAAMNNRTDSGTPVRVSDVMALAGPDDGLLRYNDVRDPAGKIHDVAAANAASRQRRENETMPTSRPGRQAVQARVRTAAPATQPQTAQAPAVAQQRDGEITATVKAGDSVALMVFRELGTRSPDVIDWVIRENNLKKDKRGNPMIYPDQTLRLPKDGRLVQSASR